jgi:hypothetical protein
MLAVARNRKRFLEMTQIILGFISTCAVVDAARIQAAPLDRPGYSAKRPLESDSNDRRLGDLARADRKRREAEQLASRRAGELVQVGTKIAG